MATVIATPQSANSARTKRFFYEAMGNDDTGSPQLIGERADGSIQAIGTFGGATVTLEGSNDGTNWVGLTDETGTAISFTAAGLKMFLPRVWKIRPVTAGGSGTDVDIYILLGS